MFRVVQTDRDKFADTPDARPDAHRRLNQRQGLEIELAELVESCRRQGVSGNVFHHVDEAAHVARGVEDAR